MPTINPVEPVDGQNATAGSITSVTLAILSLINGGLDHDNLAAGGIQGSNLAANAVTVDKLGANALTGWTPLANLPSTITLLGNRSYQVVFNAVDLTGLLSNGMRFRATRSAPAPTQCTSLNGSTQYFSKTSPAGMSFTDTFTCSAWVKLTSYSTECIISRYNGTSGWSFTINSAGQLTLTGFNGGSSNYRQIISYASLPLNKWVHVAGTFQMSDHTSTTCALYIDGLPVPATIGSGGTNPTALIQAGNLEVGSFNGGVAPFAGELAQVAVYSAVLTQSTILAAMSQTLTGTEPNLVSAYSFNNSLNDLNANANNLTANGSAVATAADSPYAQGVTAGTLEYGIITGVAFSTNTTVTVQVPEGSALPTSGGVSAASYSNVKAPYKFPLEPAKWLVESIYKIDTTQASPVQNTWYNLNQQLSIPMGAWMAGYSSETGADRGSAGRTDAQITLSTANNAESDNRFTAGQAAGNSTFSAASLRVSEPLVVGAATLCYLNTRVTQASMSNLYTLAGSFLSPTIIRAANAYL